MSNRDFIQAVRAGEMPLDYFSKKLKEKFTGLEMPARRYEKGVKLFRGRKFVPSQISDISYPQPHGTKLGRANPKGKPVFYATAGLATTFNECRVQAGETFCVSEWICNEPLLVVEIGFKHNPANEITSLIYEIFTEKDESFYKYTSILLGYLLGNKAISGILYPSIISESESHNLAIKPEFADQHMSLVNVVRYKILSVTSPMKYDVDEVDFAIPSNAGNLEWKGRPKQWVINEDYGSLHMTWEEGGYVARNTNNKIVLPT